MEYIHEILAWIGTLDWQKLLKILKEAGDYKEVAVLIITCITAISLIFVRRTLRVTVKEIRAEVGSIKKQLEASSGRFHADLDRSIGKLNTNMQVTLDRVDAAGDTLAKKVDFVKRELEFVIEDALARSNLPLNDNSSHAGQLADKADYWEDLREQWEKTKKEVDQRIATVIKQLTDGRRRRRYADNIDKRNYEAVILKLYEDNWIDDDSSNALLEMNLLFNSRKNRKRPVTKDELEKFKEWRNQWLSAGQIELRVAAE